MKIAWFTPFAKQSAIGRYSKCATEALAEFCNAEVDIFAEPADEMHQTKNRIILYTEADEALVKLSQYDMAVYNMGDYLAYHKKIFDVLQKRPGIVIAHDICLSDFFHQYYAGNAEEYVSGLIEFYGEEGMRKILHAASNRLIWHSFDLLKYNMSPFLFKYAQGIIVHSQYHADQLKGIYDGLIGVVPLIYGVDELTSVSAVENVQDKINILTVGMVNANKLITKVMDAIADSKFLRKNVCYKVVGPTEDGSYLQEILNKLRQKKLDKSVKIIGRVDEKSLAEYYSKADIVCNLRFPAIEGASASLQEQLMLGKPAVVANHGVYAGVPDDCVVKVDLKNLKESFVEKITELVKNPELRKRIGQNALNYAKEAYDPEKYATEFMKIAPRMAQLDPVFLNMFYVMLKSVKNEFLSMGIKGDQVGIVFQENTAREIEKLFSHPVGEESK